MNGIASNIQSAVGSNVGYYYMSVFYLKSKTSKKTHLVNLSVIKFAIKTKTFHKSKK